MLDNHAVGLQAFERVDHAHIGVGHGVCVIIGIDPSDVGFFALQIKPVHMVLLRGQKIDSLVMYRSKGAVPVHLGDDLMIGLVGGIDYHDIFRIDGAQADFVGGITLRRPVPAVGHTVQHAFFFQIQQELFQWLAAELFSFFKRQLKSRAFDMVQKDEEIVGIDAAVLRRPREKIFGIFHDKLIQRIAPADENRQRMAGSPARAPRLLPGAGDRAGVACHDAGLQIADIDTKLQRIGADDPHHLA